MADMKTTMPPVTRHDSPDPAGNGYDPDRTAANMRFRLEHGDLQVDDIILNRYELLEKLGTGAMGMVFKCRDRVSRVEYALKMVPPVLARDAEAMEDVRQNFQLVHGLKHPNIASMDFLDRDEYGAYFLIMEYASGESLAQWIRRKWKTGRPELSEVANIVRQIASALDYAHRRQILHRDIKPANVMVDDQDNVKVLDFGLASKVRSTMTALSVNPANSSGTPNYLSPEQFKGRYPGPAADQYALGVLTYQMLAGHLPFEADDFNVLSRAVLQEEPDRIDGLPDTVNRCLLKVLSKDPKERFESCTAFAEALTGASEAPKPELKSEPAKPEAPKTEPKPEPEPAKEEPKPELKSEPAKQETTTSAPSNIPQSDLRWTGCTDFVLSQRQSASGTGSDAVARERQDGISEKDIITRPEIWNLDVMIPAIGLHTLVLIPIVVWLISGEKTWLWIAGFFGSLVVWLGYYPVIWCILLPWKRMKRLLKAANQNDSDAQFKLGVCYETGDGVYKNDGKAVECFQKAADQNHVLAQFKLGSCYYVGRGVGQDYQKAAEWFKKSAEQGNADAQSNFGDCCYNGRGVEKDIEEAVKWYRGAAGQGNGYAKTKLKELGR